MDTILIRDYLLGRLPEDGQSRVEEKLMADDEFFAQFLAEEDELIDDYLRGLLKPDEIYSFERHFLVAPERRQRLSFVQSLHQYVNGRATGPDFIVDERQAPNWWRKLRVSGLLNPSHGYRLPVAVTLLIAALLGSWVIYQIVESRRTSSSTQGEIVLLRQREAALQEQVAKLSLERDRIAKELQNRQDDVARLEEKMKLLQAQATSPKSTFSQIAAIPVFALGAISLRDISKATKIEIPLGARQIKLKLYLDGDSPTVYQASLQTDTGKDVRQWQNLIARRRSGVPSVSIMIPTGLLGMDNYQIRLKAGANYTSEVGRYYFQIVQPQK